ncbi:hypothetical protein [Lentibacillus sp. Marseille-P4043]|uniref:hypothetical protein n=1 Tax=Lentibacillus sp. Marseille-P4043 TaxID=2040293 RepID=UPI000D0ACBD8|nr:hypothetical protein [Lentibacillus sp. Marseille-P4043]
MRKLFVLLCCSVSLLFLVSACENQEDAATELGEKFIKELYSVDDPSVDAKKMGIEELMDFQDNFSSYFTKKEFEDLEKIRFFTIPQEVANKLNNKISVQRISIKKSDGDQNFEHTFTLIFTDQDGNKVDEEEMKGQMTIVDTKNGLKIDRYYDGAEKTLVNK